jgi:hypothetical protein
MQSLHISSQSVECLSDSQHKNFSIEHNSEADLPSKSESTADLTKSSKSKN